MLGFECLASKGKVLKPRLFTLPGFDFGYAHYFSKNTTRTECRIFAGL